MKNSLLSIFVVVLLTECFSCSEVVKAQSIYFYDGFAAQQQMDTITDLRIMEASGMDISHLNPGYFWTHNDSGDTARIFLIDRNGTIIATVFLEGVINRDWEEIVTVRDSTGSWIYVAEIGDNQAIYPSLMIHRFAEPMVGSDTIIQITIGQIETMHFVYPNGARDAEAIFYDYNTNKMVLITKREQACFIFSFDFQVGTGWMLPEPLGTLPSKNFVAADMRPNGEILLKTYNEIFYWPASKESAAARMLKGFQYKIPYIPEPQGESICWDIDGNFYTITELNKGKIQQLLYFERKN